MPTASTCRSLWLKYRFHSLRGNNSIVLPTGKRCFVFLAADYGNLGDVAITYAQEQLLAQMFAGYHIVDVPISHTLSWLRPVQRAITPQDVVTIVGGGNMMDRYYDIELMRQLVIKAFPRNRIISFPQTMLYSGGPAGRYLQRKAQRLYGKHQHLQLMAREATSYQSMQALFGPGKVALTPDVVMLLDERHLVSRERSGVIWCVRADGESALTDAQRTALKSCITSQGYTVTDYDTHIGHGGLSLKEREAELHKIWTAFGSAQWVVTDRLHGMIFAFITGTPAIVLANNNFKIQGCYQWIKDCGYIHFLQSADATAISEIMKSVPSTANFEKIHNELRTKFVSAIKL